MAILVHWSYATRESHFGVNSIAAFTVEDQPLQVIYLAVKLRSYKLKSLVDLN